MSKGLKIASLVLAGAMLTGAGVATGTFLTHNKADARIEQAEKEFEDKYSVQVGYTEEEVAQARQEEKEKAELEKQKVIDELTKQAEAEKQEALKNAQQQAEQDKQQAVQEAYKNGLEYSQEQNCVLTEALDIILKGGEIKEFGENETKFNFICASVYSRDYPGIFYIKPDGEVIKVLENAQRMYGNIVVNNKIYFVADFKGKYEYTYDYKAFVLNFADSQIKELEGFDEDSNSAAALANVFESYILDGDCIILPGHDTNAYKINTQNDSVEKIDNSLIKDEIVTSTGSLACDLYERTKHLEDCFDSIKEHQYILYDTWDAFKIVKYQDGVLKEIYKAEEGDFYSQYVSRLSKLNVLVFKDNESQNYTAVNLLTGQINTQSLENMENEYTMNDKFMIYANKLDGCAYKWDFETNTTEKLGDTGVVKKVFWEEISGSFAFMVSFILTENNGNYQLYELKENEPIKLLVENIDNETVQLGVTDGPNGHIFFTFYKDGALKYLHFFDDTDTFKITDSEYGPY